MSETEISAIRPAGGGEAAALRELQQELQSLRSFVLGVVTVVILLSGAVNLFLLRQASLVNGQLAVQLQENKANLDEFASRTGPAAAAFWKNVNDFAKTNPDLAPLLAKYNFVPNAAPAAPKK